MLKREKMYVQNVSIAAFFCSNRNSSHLSMYSFLFFSCFIRFIKIFKPKELDSTHKWTIRFKYRGK